MIACLLGQIGRDSFSLRAGSEFCFLVAREMAGLDGSFNHITLRIFWWFLPIIPNPLIFDLFTHDFDSLSLNRRVPLRPFIRLWDFVDATPSRTRPLVFYVTSRLYIPLLIWGIKFGTSRQ